MIHNSSLYSKILHSFEKFHWQIEKKNAIAIVLRSFDQMAIADRDLDRRSLMHWLPVTMHQRTKTLFRSSCIKITLETYCIVQENQFVFIISFNFGNS